MNLSVWENIMKFSFIFAVAFFIATVIVIIKFNIISSLIFEIKQKKSTTGIQTHNISPPASPVTEKHTSVPETIPLVSEKKLTATVSVRNVQSSATLPVFSKKETADKDDYISTNPAASSGTHKDTIIVKKPSPVFTDRDDDTFTVTQSIIVFSASEEDLLSIEKS